VNLPKSVLYYGTESPIAQQLPLRAGPLSLLLFEGTLQYVKLGDREILRRVYFALRDHNWDTVPVRLSNLRKEVRDDSFRITYEAYNKHNDVDFGWEGIITGQTDGTITFAMRGEARSTFLRNRLGFCVLHPVRECVGRPCRIECENGAILDTYFPQPISPHQPFMDVRAASHEIVPGVWAEVRFDGEVFETEDQRNWTDSSYKTYSTPLRIPYPVAVEAGMKVKQTITVSLTGTVPPSLAETARRGGEH